MRAELQARELSDLLTVHVRIVGWRGVAVRLRLVLWLLALVAWVAPFRVDVARAEDL